MRSQAVRVWHDWKVQPITNYRNNQQYIQTPPQQSQPASNHRPARHLSLASLVILIKQLTGNNG